MIVGWYVPYSQLTMIYRSAFEHNLMISFQTFSLKNNLKRHIIEVHTGQKQRTVVLKNCTICDKVRNRQHLLQMDSFII